MFGWFRRRRSGNRSGTASRQVNKENSAHRPTDLFQVEGHYQLFAISSRKPSMDDLSFMVNAAGFNDDVLEAMTGPKVNAAMYSADEIATIAKELGIPPGPVAALIVPVVGVQLSVMLDEPELSMKDGVIELQSGARVCLHLAWQGTMPRGGTGVLLTLLRAGG
ncbi:MAG: hypothetical protein HYU66_03395 [Armatimonadetes bacterium]|nr:hypothetical protein [Armatimonadota bacterium]